MFSQKLTAGLNLELQLQDLRPKAYIAASQKFESQKTTGQMPKHQAKSSSSWEKPKLLPKVIGKSAKRKVRDSAEAENIWTCPYCQMKFEADSRAKLTENLANRHPKEPRGPSTWMRSQTDIILIASKKVPEEQSIARL